VPLSELVVWIDPIDNTKGFIKGTLDAVTVLIGMSRKDRAFLGVLALPYIFDGHQQIFKPEILMGTVEGRKAFSSVLEGSWT
jgi:3'-phosphoadenosine 5'-phosphosulfate (PAPS) 3'-phosphatase